MRLDPDLAALVRGDRNKKGAEENPKLRRHADGHPTIRLAGGLSKLVRVEPPVAPRVGRERLRARHLSFRLLAAPRGIECESAQAAMMRLYRGSLGLLGGEERTGLLEVGKGMRGLRALGALARESEVGVGVRRVDLEGTPVKVCRQVGRTGGVRVETLEHNTHGSSARGIALQGEF